MISLWEGYLKEAKQDDSVRVIVVTINIHHQGVFRN
jgi:hypothetical protein